MVFMAVDDALAPYALADLRKCRLWARQRTWTSSSAHLEERADRALSRSADDIQPLTTSDLPGTLNDHRSVWRRSHSACTWIFRPIATCWSCGDMPTASGLAAERGPHLPCGPGARAQHIRDARQGAKLDLLAAVTCRMSKSRPRTSCRLLSASSSRRRSAFRSSRGPTKRF